MLVATSLRIQTKRRRFHQDADPMYVLGKTADDDFCTNLFQ